MRTRSLFSFIFALVFSLPAFATPPHLILQNQYGETSINTVVGSTNYIGPSVAANTFIANLTGSSASPTANTVGTVQTKLLMGGFTATPGTVGASDTLLQGEQKLAGNQNQLKNGQFTPSTETVSAAGAISTTIMESILSNAGGSTFAATLAAPSSQDGQLKVLKMGTATHTVTVAMTNIATSGAYTASGTTTLTFTAPDDSAVFIAIGAKWVYLGGSAVAS